MLMFAEAEISKLVLGQYPEDEFVYELVICLKINYFGITKAELNPRVRCASGNVLTSTIYQNSQNCHKRVFAQPGFGGHCHTHHR